MLAAVYVEPKFTVSRFLEEFRAYLPRKFAQTTKGARDHAATRTAMASFLLLHLSPVSLLARRVAPRHARAFRGTPSLTTGATRGTPSSPS